MLLTFVQTPLLTKQSCMELSRVPGVLRKAELRLSLFSQSPLFTGNRPCTHMGSMINRFKKWPSKSEQSGPKLCIWDCRGCNWVGKRKRVREGMGEDPFLQFSLCFLGSSPMETLTLQVYFQLGPRTLASCQQKLCGPACGAVHQPPGQLQDWRARHRRPCRCQVGKSSPVSSRQGLLGALEVPVSGPQELRWRSTLHIVAVGSCLVDDVRNS